MKCPHCKKEIGESLHDNTPGAVFVTKDTGNDHSFVWPAILGLKKYRGCVEFGPATDDHPAHNSSYDDGTSMKLNDKECDNIYGEHPCCGDAWLVKPCGDEWLWEHVDTNIMFSEND